MRVHRGRLAVLAGLVMVILAAGCTRQQAQQPGQPAPAEKLKVGLVYDVGGRGDLSFNDMAFAGLERAQQEFGDRIETRDLEPTAGGENREELLRLLAGEGFNLIFGIGFLFTDSIQRVAKEFPDVRFGLIDGFIEGLDANSNVVCLQFKEHEGSFLVGAAAALKSQTGVVGFVGGMKIPLIEKFEVGYIAGARYAKPSVRVLSDYAGTTGEAFRDPVKGKELALAQYDRQADIIYHASGGTGIGVFEAAVTKDKLAIGVDADQSLTVKEDQRAQILTSMTKRVDVAVFDTIKARVENAFAGGYRTFGLTEDGVGYAENDYNRDMIADIKDRLEELKQKIIAGEIDVPQDRTELNAFLQNLPK
jgi:basic membrane protein A and related proteins